VALEFFHNCETALWNYYQGLHSATVVPASLASVYCVWSMRTTGITLEICLKPEKWRDKRAAMRP